MTSNKTEHDTVKEYVTREERVWEQLVQMAVQATEDEELARSPVHDQMRGMLLLRRSQIPQLNAKDVQQRLQ